MTFFLWVASEPVPSLRSSGRGLSSFPGPRLKLQVTEHLSSEPQNYGTSHPRKSDLQNQWPLQICFLRAFPDIYGPSAGFALLAYEWKPLFTFSLCEALGNIEKSAIWIKLIMIIKNVLPTPHYSSNIANLKWVLAHNSNSGEPPDLSRLSFLHHRALVLFIWLCAVLLQWTTLKLNVTYLRAQKHSYQT